MPTIDFLTAFTVDVVGGTLRAITESRRRAMSARPLLEIEDLSVEFATERGPLRAVYGVNLSVAASRALGIVGESGSGKTILSRAVLQLLPRDARVSGSVRFDGQRPLPVVARSDCGDCAGARSPSSSRTR